MDKKPYRVTRDGRLIIRDIEAVRARQKDVMKLLDAIPDDPAPPAEGGLASPAEAPTAARRRRRSGKAG